MSYHRVMFVNSQAVLLISAILSPAQEPSHRPTAWVLHSESRPFMGPSSQTAIADIGTARDLNADGHADYLIMDANRLAAVSGLDQRILFEMDSTTSGLPIGSKLIGGVPIDSDLIPDFFVSGSGKAAAVSGSDQRLLFGFDSPFVETTSFGTSLLLLRHETGRPPVIVIGDPDESSIYGFSGMDGQFLFRQARTKKTRFGWSTVDLDDIDGDGYLDFGVSSPSGVFPGSLEVLSGRNGDLITILENVVPNNRDSLQNLCLTRVGDQDGDGIADLVVGNPLFFHKSSGRPFIGAASVFSLGQGVRIWSHEGDTTYGRFGYDVAGLGDMDGDGVSEIAIAGDPNQWGNRSVVIFSGKKMQVAYLVGDLKQPAIGHGNDVNHDVWPDLLVAGEFLISVQRPRVSFVVSRMPILTSSTYEWSLSTDPPLGFQIQFPPEENGMAYRILFSPGAPGWTYFRGLGIPLQRNLVFSYSLGSWRAPGFTGRSGFLNSSGAATASLTSTPELMRFSGRSLSLACISFDPQSGMQPRMSSLPVTVQLLP